MKKHLLLRGAVEMLDSAIRYIGRSQGVNEWNGRYRDGAVEDADGKLRHARWHVQRELDDARIEKCLHHKR